MKQICIPHHSSPPSVNFSNHSFWPNRHISIFSVFLNYQKRGQNIKDKLDYVLHANEGANGSPSGSQ